MTHSCGRREWDAAHPREPLFGKTRIPSHLAMRGAPARAIQELAGHANITTTQRYMHLSPAAIEGAIRLLDGPVGGEMGEARKGATGKLLG